MTVIDEGGGAGRPALLCVGDVDMDLVLRVPHLPGRDEKVGGDTMAWAPGGMAANVSVGARRLGTPARLVGAVGDDALGREALAHLGAEGIDLAHVAVRRGTATFFCVILVDDSGEKALVRAMSGAYLPRPDELTASAFDGVAHVHLTFTRPDLADRAIALARDAGARLSLDLEAADILADRAFMGRLVAEVDILFLSAQSRRDLEAALGPLAPKGEAMIVTTNGAAGARVETAGGTRAVHGHRVAAKDTLGAGDAFAAAFLHARLQGTDPGAALDLANAAGALSTLAYGAQTGLPDGPALQRFLAERRAGAADG